MSHPSIPHPHPTTDHTSNHDNMTPQEYSDYLYSHKNCYVPPYYNDNHNQHHPHPSNFDTINLHPSPFDTYTPNNSFSGPSGINTTDNQPLGIH